MKLQHALLPKWENSSVNERSTKLENLVEDLIGYGFNHLSLEDQDNVKESVDNMYKVVLKTRIQNIENILDKYLPKTEKESNDIKIIREHLDKNSNLLSVNCENAHFTASALVVDKTSGKFLLHLHKKLNKWLQFGGHLDYETDLSLSALREAKEETGLTDLEFYPKESQPFPLDIDVHVIPEGKERPEHFHLDFRYLLTTQNPNAVMVDEAQESNTFKWFDINDENSYSDLNNPDLLRLVNKMKEIFIRTSKN
jgi:8-oxo-dGTP pyrophosphatase MutT (NUDIX family)